MKDSLVCPSGKNDHQSLEMKTFEECECQEEAYKEKRKNYAKTDYIELKTFFNGQI